MSHNREAKQTEPIHEEKETVQTEISGKSDVSDKTEHATSI
jgi:hypothetical protein